MWADEGEVEGFDPSREAAELAALRARMEEAAANVDPAVVDYVQGTLAYGVAQTRTEYRWFANRNWGLIRRFGAQLRRVFAVLVVMLLLLGVANWLGFEELTGAQHDIQGSRRERLLDQCQKGNAFIVKLREEIDSIPDPVKRAEEKAQETATIQLVRTLVTTTLPEGVPLTPDVLARAEADCVRTVRRQLH